VLEPSPPAIDEGRDDDPTARGEVPEGRQLVSPVSTGDLTWDELARGDAELAEWCAVRWLGAWRRLPEAPSDLVETRLALHRIAELVVSPARERATGGEISLRYTRGGFGTPFFGPDRQVRVEGTEIVNQERGVESRAAIESCRQAAEVVGGLEPGEIDDEPLSIDPASARFIGDWFGFVTMVVAELRAEATADQDPSLLNLWPEHFDVAAELGAEATGRRAGYGGSPGDEDHPAPYIYVAPWQAPAPGELWQASGFSGAEMSYAELLAAGDQREAALDFFRARVRALEDGV
jgi:hypothetical protein